MNKNFYRIVFNQRCGCLMAVAETAISSSKSPSGTSKANRRSSKCSKTTKAGQFSLSNVPPSQSIRVQAAPDLIVFLSRADSQINLLAAKNESSQTSTNSSSSGSVGVSYGIFTGSVSVNASASKGKGSSNAQDTSYSNTSITAGNTAAITSGGDTALRGAVVAANQIKADIGGSLSIESLQDKSTFASSQKSGGASISVPITAGGSAGASVSASKSNVDSNFQSVGQQSGLKAGDGGFQVSVNNNTDLKGGVISSTQQAINNNKNSLSTGGALSITDIQNTASFSGKAVGASLGAGTQPAGGTGLSGVGVGLGSTGGNAASTSSAGISGIAGNTAVRTGDAETGLQQIFDADKVQKDINAQVAITQAFSREAPKAAATFLDNQIKDLQDQLGDQSISPARRAQLEQGIKDRSEGGIIRIAVHTLMGAMGGGVSGALGAAASASAAPLMNQLQDGITVALKDAGLGDTAAKGIASGITGLTAAGLGAAGGELRARQPALLWMLIIGSCIRRRFSGLKPMPIAMHCKKASAWPMLKSSWQSRRLGRCSLVWKARRIRVRKHSSNLLEINCCLAMQTYRVKLWATCSKLTRYRRLIRGCMQIRSQQTLIFISRMASGCRVLMQ